MTECRFTDRQNVNFAFHPEKEMLKGFNFPIKVHN